MVLSHQGMVLSHQGMASHVREWSSHIREWYQHCKQCYFVSKCNEHSECNKRKQLDPLHRAVDGAMGFVTKWGTAGANDGQFNTPFDIESNPGLNTRHYVVDEGNARIQVFDSNGNFITKWGSFGFRRRTIPGSSTFAVDGPGNVYVSDIGLDRIQKFDSNGNFITKWGSTGTGDGQSQPSRRFSLLICGWGTHLRGR